MEKPGDLGILDDDIGDLIYGFRLCGVEGDDGEGSFGLGIMNFLSEHVIPVKILLIRNLEEIMHDFEQRLKTIFGFGREDEDGIHWGRWTGGICESCLEEIVWDPSTFGGVRRSMTWRQFILALGLHTAEEMAEDGFGAYWLRSERLIPDKGDLSDYSVEISSHGFLERHIEGRKSGARLLGGHFIGRLAHHFGLVSDDGLRGLSVMARELPLIDMGELVKLYICMEFRYDWAWVAPRPERQQVAAAGAPKAAEYAPAVDEGTQADPAPVQAPQPPPPPPAAGRTMPQRLERLEEEIQGLRRDVRSLRGLVESSMTD
ncbi:hypothetical protein Tco_0413047 [Tanacetum coccineum]